MNISMKLAGNKNPAVLTINDQGGERMRVGYGKSYRVGTSPGRDFSCMEKTSTTLRVSTYKNGVLTVRNEPKIYENHSQDARYREMGDCAPTCHAQMGTGGNNVPILVKQEDGDGSRISKSGNTEATRLTA